MINLKRKRQKKIIFITQKCRRVDRVTSRWVSAIKNQADEDAGEGGVPACVDVALPAADVQAPDVDLVSGLQLDHAAGGALLPPVVAFAAGQPVAVVVDCQSCAIIVLQSIIWDR